MLRLLAARFLVVTLAACSPDPLDGASAPVATPSASTAPAPAASSSAPREDPAAAAAGSRAIEEAEAALLDAFDRKPRVDVAAWLRENEITGAAPVAGPSVGSRYDACIALDAGTPAAPSILCRGAAGLPEDRHDHDWWWLWRKEGHAARLVFRVVRRSYWMRTTVEVDPGGASLLVEVPGCAAASNEATEKGLKMPDGAQASNTRACGARGTWSWRGGNFVQEKQ